MPGAPAAALAEVPTTETEQPGMGGALGSVVGGAVGASGGLMSVAVLSAIIPGIGPVMAVGLAAWEPWSARSGVCPRVPRLEVPWNRPWQTACPKMNSFSMRTRSGKGGTAPMVLTEGWGLFYKRVLYQGQQE